jgi:hypothetical protein
MELLSIFTLSPDKEIGIKNITVYVSGYTEIDMTGILSPPTVWPFSVAADINGNVFDLSGVCPDCCVVSGFNVAAV